jgi:hypothetical protein
MPMIGGTGVGNGVGDYVPYPNVIINGTFDADTNWNKSDGTWTIGAGVATGASVTTGVLSAAVAPLTVGLRYKVSYVLTVTAGDIRCGDGTANGVTRTTSGTYWEYLTAQATGFQFSSPSSNFSGTIDNVVVYRE